MKSKKGVTLIALVITIIVLLILAGVSISLVVGDTGVFTQADDAVTKTDRAGAKEALDRAIMGKQGEFTSAFNDDTNMTFYDWFVKQVEVAGDKTKVLTENGYTIEVEKVGISDGGKNDDMIVGSIQKGERNENTGEQEFTVYVFEIARRGTDFIGVDIKSLKKEDADKLTTGKDKSDPWAEKDELFPDGTIKDGVEELIP